MTISPDQCRAARGFFAMSRQELANASGVSLRTITSFEDTTDRVPTAANLASDPNRAATPWCRVQSCRGGVGSSIYRKAKRE